MDDYGPLIEQQIPRLRRYARALTGDRVIADDLVQDTLERAWSKLHLWRRGSDLRAWLFTVMHNVYVNQLRSRAFARVDRLDQPFDPAQITRVDLVPPAAEREGEHCASGAKLRSLVDSVAKRSMRGVSVPRSRPPP